MSKCKSGCGTNPCGCGNNPCGCTPGCSTGCCQDIIPPAPSPYYSCAPACAENHCGIEVRAAFVAALRVENAFNMPECDASAELKVSGLVSIGLGAYLWNASVGYLRVDAFNPSTGIITVTNTCETGNAAPGTTFPVCTLFTVSDPPSISGGDNPEGIFVALDFTAPAVSTCLLITVTDVTGISAGNNVQIGGATYRVSAVNSATTITICNDGAGLTPGSPVIAKNGSGQYQYPVTLITVNPCDQDPVDSGAVIVCDGGVAKPLGGDAAGQVLSLVDPETGEAEYITLSVQERTCTLIQCCLTLQPDVLSYLITVADSSEFTVGDVCQIGTRSERWTITDIPDATHIQATTDTNPAAIEEIAEGTTFCIVTCCEENEILINCGPQGIYGDIPQLGPSAQAITLTPDGEGGGSYTVTLSSNVMTIDLAERFPSCNPETQVTVIAHISLGTLNTWEPGTIVLGEGSAIPAPLAWYDEFAFKWNTGNAPAGDLTGKVVRTHTIQDGKLGGFPALTGRLFSQIASPGTDYPMDYNQVDVSCRCVVTAADTVTLSMLYTAILGGQYAANLATPLNLGDVRYLVSGWVEIIRSE